MFAVDGNGLVTTLMTLDFESVKSYLLVVTVTDGGSPQFSTDTTVSIQVTGTNEFSPVFSNSTYAVSHSEVSYSVLIYLSFRTPAQKKTSTISYEPSQLVLPVSLTFC